MVKRIVWSINPEVRYNIQTVRRDGYEWECWQTIVWEWGLCWPKWHKMYYDGWHYALGCCIGTLYFEWNDNFNERRKLEL